jgi:DUF971 family protein
MDSIRPLGISANRNERIMKVTWNDGHLSEYPFWLLRAACPCAGCRGGHENMRSEPDPAVFSASQEETDANRMARVEQVGGYAVNFEWQDGHHYGIFTWHYLRELCPCPICRAKA